MSRGGKKSGFNFSSKPILVSKKDTALISPPQSNNSYQSILAESFTSGIGSGIGFQMTSRAIDSIFGPKTVNVNTIQSESVNSSDGCITELSNFMNCVKTDGYYVCNKSFNEFEKCYSK